jgi:hypothetical protein
MLQKPAELGQRIEKLEQSSVFAAYPRRLLK